MASKDTSDLKSNLLSSEPSKYSEIDEDIAKFKLKWKHLNMGKVIEKIKDNGRYQKRLVMLGIFLLFSCSFTSFVVGYLAPDPIPEC